MASLRRKYQPQFESPRQEEPPVTSPPAVTAAELPEPVADAKPPEQIEPQSPADAAASSAIQDRLAEMQRAEQLAQQPRQQQQPAPQPQQQEVPAAVAKFLAENPRFMDPNDAVSQAEIYTATLKANRDGLKWDDDNFIPAIQRHLGISNGHAERHKNIIPNENNDPPPRPAAPPRQPARPMSGPPVSAPPTRQAPSMSTGRAPNFRQPLNKEEVEVAQSLGVSLDEYQRNKERWQKMKAEGAQ